MEEQLFYGYWGDDGRSHLSESWLFELLGCVTLPDWFHTVVSVPLLLPARAELASVQRFASHATSESGR